jgi:uncharacterized damage-inducible protein DinB
MKSALDQRLNKMDQELQQLLDLLAPLGHATLNQQPADGGWSVLQVMHHLILSEEGSLRYVKKKMSFNPELKRGGWGHRLRSLLLSVFLGLPFKFKAPKGVAGEALPTESDFQATAQRWLDTRRELRGFIAELPPEVLRTALYRHPRAGRLTLMGMLRFFHEHFRRHRAQIERVLKAVA